MQKLFVLSKTQTDPVSLQKDKLPSNNNALVGFSNKCFCSHLTEALLEPLTTTNSSTSSISDILEYCECMADSNECFIFN